MLFFILKWIHVLSTITAVGLNMTYGIWLARAARNPEHLAFTLRGIKILDDRMANPAYGLLLITGLAMVFTTPTPMMTPWLITGFVLFIVVALIGIFGYSRTLKRQIALAEAGAAGTPEYQAVSSLGRLQGILLGVLVIAITFLMVVKPPLWATA